MYPTLVGYFLNSQAHFLTPIITAALVVTCSHTDRFLATLCHLQNNAVPCYPADEFPEGIDLLAYIYNEAENYSCHYSYHLLLSLLYDTSQPYLRCVYFCKWLRTGFTENSVYFTLLYFIDSVLLILIDCNSRVTLSWEVEALTETIIRYTFSVQVIHVLSDLHVYGYGSLNGGICPWWMTYLGSQSYAVAWYTFIGFYRIGCSKDGVQTHLKSLL